MTNWIFLWILFIIIIIPLFLVKSIIQVKIFTYILIIYLIISCSFILCLHIQSQIFCNNYFNLLFQINKTQYLEPEKENQYISSVLDINEKIQVWQNKYQTIPLEWNFYDKRIPTLQQITLNCLN